MVLIALAFVVGCHHAAAPVGAPVTVAPELENVDVFGSRQLDRTTLIQKWGDKLVALVRAYEDQGDWDSINRELTAAIERAGNYAFVQVSIVGYYDQRRPYVTVDLVDEADRERRMTFAPAPTGEHPDPDGLIALWIEYEKTATNLLSTGAIKATKDCPFWHCLTFDHASLVPYRDAFGARAPAVEPQLVSVLREDNRTHHRAAAAFLLAHLASGERVVELELPAIRDPEELVRNNAMRVLALIAINHPEIPIPIEPILDALAFPTTTDRNKASAILSGITKRPGLTAANRAMIKERAGELLVDMLALRQPNNHDFAYQILKNVSGQDFGEHAVVAWRGWARGTTPAP